MKKINKDTIIEMSPDKNGVFKPIGKVVNIPPVKRYSYRTSPVRNRKTRTRISEFLEGFSIGIELINKFKRSIYR